MDCSSLSIPINSPLPDSFFMIDLECPPLPSVPSIYIPSGLIFKAELLR